MGLFDTISLCLIFLIILPQIIFKNKSKMSNKTSQYLSMGALLILPLVYYVCREDIYAFVKNSFKPTLPKVDRKNKSAENTQNSEGERTERSQN